MTEDVHLAARGISHVHSGGGGTVPALQHVSLNLPRATFTCLVGPSGCGKSTLLRILAGLLPPTEGDILLDGAPLTEPQRHIGLAFQDPTLMPWRTVRENLVLPLELLGVARAEQADRAAQMLGMLGLEDFGAVYPPALSGGMAQRLSIGRALMHNPDILLLDEPFGALDALTREQISAELLRIWAYDRKTVLMVTHNIHEAAWLADRVLVMSPRPGRIVRHIPVELPRPRHLDVFGSPEFQQIEQAIRHALRASGA